MVVSLSPAPRSTQFAAVRQRRLLLLSTDMGMGGGAEEQVIHLAYGLRSRGWEVMIVSMLPPSPMPPDFANRGIPLKHLGMRRGIPSLRSTLQLARLIREFQPDVVHSHMTHANLLARAVRIICRYPVLVCTLHNLTMAGVERDHTTIFELAHRVSDRLAECTTAICQAAADYYVRGRAVPATKMRVMVNGIDTDRFAADSETRIRMRRELGLDDRFVWLAVGRLELQKAYPTLLRAFAHLGDTRGLLLICGQGSLKDELIALAEKLKISEFVRFLGLRCDMPDVMRAADGFALSSDMEGLPLVLLQASAASLPIVATDVGGNSEVVVDGTTGRLVSAGNPQAFAGCMAKVAAMPEADRMKMGQHGQQRVQDLFEAENVFGRWEQLYKGLLAEKNAAACGSRRTGDSQVHRVGER